MYFKRGRALIVRAVICTLLVRRMSAWAARCSSCRGVVRGWTVRLPRSAIFCQDMSPGLRAFPSRTTMFGFSISLFFVWVSCWFGLVCVIDLRGCMS